MSWHRVKEVQPLALDRNTPDGVVRLISPDALVWVVRREELPIAITLPRAADDRQAFQASKLEAVSGPRSGLHLGAVTLEIDAEALTSASTRGAGVLALTAGRAYLNVFLGGLNTERLIVADMAAGSGGTILVCRRWRLVQRRDGHEATVLFEHG